MAKIDPNFDFDIYKFLHRPLRDLDKKEDFFLEKFIKGFQGQTEDLHAKIAQLVDLYNPATTPQPRYLKDIVGLTKELDNIVNDITDDDLRKLIGLAVSLWKQKSLEIGYVNIIRLFTGKNSRVFNWFDYRWIIGEKAIGEEQLGEDAWLISVPLVGASNPTGNVVALYSFEQNYRDRSIVKNDAISHGPIIHYALGPVSGSSYYAQFIGGYLTAVNHPAIDFSGSFTIEMFFKTSTVSALAILFSKIVPLKGVQIQLKTSTNEITYVVQDGATSKTETLTSAGTLADNTWRHVALVLDRTNNKVRLYLNGTESTTGLSLAGFGNPTANADLFIGAAGHASLVYNGAMDNFRISKSAQYNVNLATLPVPAVTFVEYQEEQLDEFFSDIRIVDDGNLNRTLVKRILNLMRPISERLRIVYVRFYENFTFGKGELVTATGSSSVATGAMVMQPNTVEICDATGNENFQDMVIQAKAKVQSGSEFGVRFLITDSDNYYLYKVNVTTKISNLYKVVGGVPTSISGPVTLEIYPNTDYVFTVVTNYSSISSTTLIECFYDSNTAHSVTDPTFVEGTFGFESFAGTVTVIDESEMLLTPLSVETVKPGDIL